MKAQELKAFGEMESVLVNTNSIRGVSGFGSSAFSTIYNKPVECEVIGIVWNEQVCMGHKSLVAKVTYINIKGEKTNGFIRFYEDDNGIFEQNINSLPREFKGFSIKD